MSKVIVVTGASEGIGEALARRLVASGERVAVAARRGERLAALARGLGENVLPVATDVTRRADVERLRDRTLERFGEIDVWVNNAGRGIARPVLALTDEDVDETMAVNLKSALYGMQAIVPYFQERGRGHVINVSSMLGKVPMAPIRSIYSAAKAALNSLTSTMRIELVATHPQVFASVVLPGIVDTGFHGNALHAPAGTQVPRGGHAPQTVDEVCDTIVALIGTPVPEAYVRAGQKEAARRYVEDPGAVEANIARFAR